MENRKESSQETTASQGNPPPTSFTSTGLNAPVSGPTRPTPNHPIQTGENFALEFMRDRAVSKMPTTSFPVTAQPPVQLPILPGSNNIEFRGIADAWLAGDENPKQNPPAVNENRPVSSPPKPVPGQGPPGAMPGCTSSEAASTSDSGRVIKVLFRFGGQLLPSQDDGKLRYVSFHTRIIAINCSISFQEFKTKTTSICNIPHTIKYILPGEDLDDLLSVSNEEDLRTMMEFGVHLDGGGNNKLKIYLLTLSDDAILNQGKMDDDSSDPDIQFPIEIDK